MAAAIPLSPELELLGACCVADEATLAALAGRLNDRIDRARFADLAAAHNMSVIVASRLPRVAPDFLTSELLTPLAERAAPAAALSLAQARMTVAALRTLQASRIEALVLKGAGLAHRFYAPHPEWRPSTDIDLLVAPAEFAAAGRALEAAGWRRTWPVNLPSRRAAPMFDFLANVFNYEWPGSGQVLELHHRLSANPFWFRNDFAAIAATSVEVDIGAGRIRTPGGGLLVAYLAWHAFSLYVYRIKWFNDLALALKAMGADSCVEACSGQGFDPRPLELADAVLGALYPGSGIGDAAPPPARRRAASEIIAALESPTGLFKIRTLERLPIEARDMLRRRGISSPRATAWDLLFALSDPRDAETLRLSPRWSLLYGLAGPFLAIGRWVTR